MPGVLTLVPTPINETSPLNPETFSILARASEAGEESIFVVEDLKPGRRRWVRFGLKRELIPELVLYNEHNWQTQSEALYQAMLKGKNVFLMSDGGTPAFCDPGRELVRKCHEGGIQVTSTPQYNSVAMALSLCGLNTDSFEFLGFLPIDKTERAAAIKRALTGPHVSVLMDTPYRLVRMLEELSASWPEKKLLFLALDLGGEKEQLLFGRPGEMLVQLKEKKREFVAVIGG